MDSKPYKKITSVFLKAVLGMALALSPVSAFAQGAETPAAPASSGDEFPALLVPLENPQGQTGYLVISATEEKNEANDVRYWTSQPNATTIIGVASENDPALNGVNPSTHPIIVEASSENDLAQPQTARGQAFFREKVKPFLAQVKEHFKTKRVALTVALAPAASYGTLIYLMSSDYVASTAAFGLVFSLNAFQALFTKSWFRIVDGGGHMLRKVAESIATNLGKPLSIDAEGRVFMAGQVLTTAAVNSILAAAMIGLEGSVDKLWAALFFGFSNTYDTWDLVVQRKFSQTTLTRVIYGRLILGGVLETLSLGGFHSVQVLMGLWTLSGLTALMAGNRLSRQYLAHAARLSARLKRARQPAMNQNPSLLKRLWNRFFKKEINCEQKLSMGDAA